MYSVKTSPRLVGDRTSHSPSFLQGLWTQGPGGGERFHSRTEPSELRKSAFCPTRLGQIAGITAKAICTNTDEGIVSDSGHTRPSVVAMFYITEFTCESAEIRIIKVEGNRNRNLRLCWVLSLVSHPSKTVVVWLGPALWPHTQGCCWGQLGLVSVMRADWIKYQMTLVSWTWGDLAWAGSSAAASVLKSWVLTHRARPEHNVRVPPWEWQHTHIWVIAELSNLQGHTQKPWQCPIPV